MEASRRRDQFERLAGVVDLLEAASWPEGQARAEANPFGGVYGPMSVAGRGEFLKRLQRWPERVRLKALAAVTCFKAPHTKRLLGVQRTFPGTAGP